MQVQQNQFRNPFIASLLLGAIAFFPSFAQEAEQNSALEAKAIAQVEATGGRVMQISAADSTREVSFYLAGKKISDANLKELTAINDVVWLNLANTKVTNEGLKSIAEMKLTKLHLEKTGIGDKGLIHLKGMTDLEYLNIYATSVTDAGLKHLEKLKNLKQLYVWQSKVSEAGMKALEEKIPGLKVVGESKLPVIKVEPKKEMKKEEAEKDESKKEEPKKKEEAPEKKNETPKVKKADK